MRQILVLFLASASSAELALALGDEDGNCCCKKGACSETHKGDRNWFQHQLESHDGPREAWCCKKLETQCGGSWVSWSGYKTPALQVAQKYGKDLALCTFGTEGGLSGISCPMFASYNSRGDCVCDHGYAPENLRGYGSLTYDWETSTWQGHCVKVECPSNAVNHPLCGCPKGFSGKVVWRGEVGARYYDGRCREAACPANAELTRPAGGGLECSCKNGFKSWSGITWMAPSGGGRKAWQGTCDPVRCPTSIFNNDLKTAFPEHTASGGSCKCAKNTVVFHKERYTKHTHLGWDKRMKRHIGTCEPRPCGSNMHRSRALDDCVCKPGYYTPPGYSPPQFTERGWVGLCAKEFADERKNRTRTTGQTGHGPTRPGPEPGARGHSGRQTRTEREERPFRAHNTHFREDPQPKKPDPTPKAHRSCGGGFFDFFANIFGGNDEDDATPAPEAPPPKAENTRREPAPRAAPKPKPEPVRKPEPVEPPPVLPRQSSRPPAGANRVRRANQDVCNACKAVYEWLPPSRSKMIDESTTKQRLKLNYRKGALLIHPDKLLNDPHAAVKGEWFKTLSACYNDLTTEYGKSTDFVDCCGLNPVFECRL